MTRPVPPGIRWPDPGGGTGVLALLAGVGLFVLAPPARAQHADAWTPGKGHGAISIAYQELFIHYHTTSTGEKQVPGTIDNHVVFLDFDYGLGDRWAINIDLPFKSNRYQGRPHPPLDDGHDHGDIFIEDGRYHGGWADWNLGLRYQWRTEPWAITPYLSYGVPARDYYTYAHSAPGTGQKRLELGINAGHRFAAPLQNLYFQGGYGYSFMEVVEHRRVNHSTLSLELGYFVTPRLTARLRVLGQKTYNGFEFPRDYPPGQNDEHLFFHDQNLRNDFVNIGAGVDYQLDDRYGLFASYGHTVWGENTHLIDYALTVGISRGF
jgi:hypothetical protein